MATQTSDVHLSIVDFACADESFNPFLKKLNRIGMFIKVRLLWYIC